ncbi:MAG: fatty acid desaturase [Nitrospirota bacterium]|jgi:stearoyl-CoA desaturase (delta-9 desaturase)|nr:fatty acid desaturase [Nitrospirota bacterium]MDH4359210.1 fatty acid desaturase [Nitrospirota bacterium]MDH5575460.1 fatty acid desaturase [Nitrospirota bacterium]
MSRTLDPSLAGTPQRDYPTMFLFGLIVMTTIIGLPVYAYFYDFSWLDWTMFITLYMITGLGITVGYHRLITHRSFKCPKWVEAAFLIAGGMALENSALRWAGDHIRHHARCDQKEDPYNATLGFWHSHCGWIFWKDPNRDPKYATRLLQDPLIMWQNKYYLPIVLTGLALPFVVGLIYNGWIGGIGCFLLAGLARAFFVLNSTFFINSICHIWGDQPHGTSNSSRDSWWISLLTFGEGYHNYHHMYQSDYRNGVRWYNFDPSKWLIWTLSKLGLAYDLRRQSPDQS